jgi:hypothetical protein
MKLAESGAREKPKTGSLWDCYLCEYNQQDCPNCLLIWPRISKFSFNRCPCTLSYYKAWFESASLEERKKLALKIANLKERE